MEKEGEEREKDGKEIKRDGEKKERRKWEVRGREEEGERERQARNHSRHVIDIERHKRLSCITLKFFLFIKTIPVHTFIMSKFNLHINCLKISYKIHYLPSLNNNFSESYLLCQTQPRPELTS